MFSHWMHMSLVALAVISVVHGKPEYKTFKRTNAQGRIPAVEYLGCGYDILYGNPLADYGSLVDPGYRNPIIAFDLVQQTGKPSRELKSAKIPGAWIRPLVSCKRSFENTIIKNLEDYQKALSVDASVGVGTVDESAKFSLSPGYSESVGLNLSDSRVLNIQKNYCFLLEAALPINGKYTFKKAFTLASSNLKENFKEGSEKCTTIKFSTNPNHTDCQDIVKPWMELFELFGTHFSYNIKIGGRLTEISQETRKRRKRSSERGAKVSAAAKTKLQVEGKAAVQHNKGYKRNSRTKVSFTYVNVLGGHPTGNHNDEDAYLRWIKSIPDNLMPIRAQLAPISKLFKSPALKEAYDDALAYYMELKGVRDSLPANGHLNSKIIKDI